MADIINFETAEYNAFGPWAYEISDRYPLPRLFAPYFTADDKAVMKIKIPREIERRKASPGMNLYDYVVALYEDRILVLKREDSTVLEKQIPLKDFKGIRIYQNLLKGGYTIFSARGSISFPFNSVSLDLFQKLTDLILERVKSRGRDISSLPVTETAPESVLLVNMLHDAQMKMSDIRVGAVQKSADVHRKGATQNMIERMLWGEMNPEALHLYTDQYLIVMENGVFPNRVGMQEFGYTQTIIPLDRIDKIEVAHSEEYSLLEESRLSLGHDQIAYHFEIDNEEVADFYNALK